MLQFVLALCLLCIIVKDFSAGRSSKQCLSGTCIVLYTDSDCFFFKKKWAVKMLLGSKYIYALKPLEFYAKQHFSALNLLI